MYLGELKHELAKKSFITRTARDYDMKYHEVERIYNLYYDIDIMKFYSRLEEFIKMRRNKE